MKNLQKLLIIIILSLGLYSCCDHRLSQTLADIESYIDSRPDSALAAIRQIDTTTLRGRSVKAKYALLHATTRLSSPSARPLNLRKKLMIRTFWEFFIQLWLTHLPKPGTTPWLRHI